ncbi:TonB-linked SusC/RagA family outer membrane protein [Mucilaginibacter oryzae]|uniref:TonB-linked SusC/RagA family outer membrane protein n=1 Tax=Mucilaginibacter oryzae TaxID=468058 RepID=A0A316HFN7_9SPHI|nr:SusC/RagA family TonB-linked outer membrane protein [Mucilaginibacter oryzae]PWK77045.1 TonB-linked SusC/RagA family outer membrane protein [Mucilaginibacter oryzae]
MNFFTLFYSPKPVRKVGLLSWAKFLAVLLFLINIHISAAAQTKKITLHLNHAPFEKLLKVLEKESGYEFLYNIHDLSKALPVTINVTELEFDKVLARCFAGQPLGYEVKDKTIVIRLKPVAAQLPYGTKADTLNIHGVVYAAEGQPLTGATVKVDITPGFSRISLVDNYGYYQIDKVPANSTLQVSYIGYETQNIPVMGRSSIDITMNTANQEMREVFVLSTGFQKLNKERATGSFGKPDMKVFGQRAATNDIVSRLDGQIAGLTVVTGLQGNGTTRQAVVRGKSTVTNGSQPLYVVNGVPVPDITALNPDDIGDITVLKDASAAAIWGAQAANGVIVITTKSGRNNQNININYSGYVTFTGKPNFGYANVMNSRQYIQAARETFDPVTYPWSSISNSFIAPHEQILYNQNRGIISAARAGEQLDSLSAITNTGQINDLWFRNGIVNNHTVSANGGGDAYSFYSSVSYTGTQSNNPGEKNDQYRLTFNQTFRPNKRVTLNLNSSFAYAYNSNKRPISIGADFIPYQLFRDGNGNNIQLNYLQGIPDERKTDYEQRSGINLNYSPLDELGSGYTRGKLLNVNATGDLTVKIWKGLSFQGTYGYQRIPGTTESYDDISKYSMRRELLNFTVAPFAGSTPVYYLPNTGGRFSTASSNAVNWTVRNQLMFTSALRNGEDHLNIQLGQDLQEQSTLVNTTIVRGYDDALKTYSLLNYQTLSQGVFGAVGSFRSVFTEKPFDTFSTLRRFRSYFALLNYSMTDKYQLDASMRRDHSNLFASNQASQNKPAYSVGARWNVGREKFIQRIGWIDNLSLRTTYGITGNSPYLNAASLYDIVNAQTNSTFGNSLYLSSPANRKLTWETTRTINIGIDMGVLNNRISGSIDAYHKNTTDLLGSISVNPLNGFIRTNGNLGNITNKGIEINLNSMNLQAGAFKWQSHMVFSYNLNKLASYSEPTPDMLTDTWQLSSQWAVGYATPVLFAYRYAGLDNMGDPQIKLANGSITKDPYAATAADLVYKGSTLPKYNGGLSNTFQYKQLSLTANMIFNLGAVMRRDVNQFYAGRLSGTAGSFSGNINPEFENRWKKPGDELNTNIPAYVASLGVNNFRRNTSYYTYADINVVSASYAKLRDITLSYGLPANIAGKLKLKTVNLYVQTGNYMIWKNNKYGIDPEYQAFNIGVRSLPQYRHTFTLGANVTF